MPILTSFTIFSHFHDFRKAVATTFLQIKKFPPVSFEIDYFYLFKNFCFPVTQICAQRSWTLVRN